jgi:hypothetical protein
MEKDLTYFSFYNGSLTTDCSHNEVTERVKFDTEFSSSVSKMTGDSR